MRSLIARLDANACVGNQKRSSRNRQGGRWFLCMCILPVASAVLFSQSDISEKLTASATSSLQVDIFCGELKTTTEFHIVIDDRDVGKVDAKFKGLMPCLESFHATLQPGAHTVKVESKRLQTSGSLPITVRPGQNWVIVNPRKESQGNRFQWSFSMQQEKSRPMYQ